ncbi:uncharacterized protein [Rhodnius prolixus]|uniref:uncharacterized protein n=1 Tax=Rhodnius prolixus TaxID=13249 RepID=UPI003D18ADB2
MEKVEEFRHLGVLFSRDGRIDQEMLNRVGVADKAYGLIRNVVVGKREVSKKVNLPHLQYGAESWTMLDKHASRVITAAEMRFLCRAEGKSKRDKIRNETIRSSLEVQPSWRIGNWGGLATSAGEEKRRGLGA